MPISDWSDLCVQTIVHEPMTGRDSYGKPSYGAPVSYRGRRVFTIGRVPGGAASQGAVVLSSQTIWILGLPSVGYEDHVRCADDPLPYAPIVQVQKYPDETGDIFVKVMLGSANT